ncbi:MAG: peptidoglycan DD-metalloendopeptidase family protein [Turicibacter sp.]|nr:peptidoglycan DD-metalloendopeptidase family protein [Turicibacter sp.]
MPRRPTSRTRKDLLSETEKPTYNPTEDFGDKLGNAVETVITAPANVINAGKAVADFFSDDKKSDKISTGEGNISDKVFTYTKDSDKMQFDNDITKDKMSVSGKREDEPSEAATKSEKSNPRRRGKKPTRRQLEIALATEEHADIKAIICEELRLPQNSTDSEIIEELACKADFGVKLPPIVEQKITQIRESFGVSTLTDSEIIRNPKIFNLDNSDKTSFEEFEFNSDETHQDGQADDFVSDKVDFKPHIEDELEEQSTSYPIDFNDSKGSRLDTEREKFNDVKDLQERLQLNYNPHVKHKKVDTANEKILAVSDKNYNVLLGKFANIDEKSDKKAEKSAQYYNKRLTHRDSQGKKIKGEFRGEFKQINKAVRKTTYNDLTAEDTREDGQKIQNDISMDIADIGLDNTKKVLSSQIDLALKTSERILAPTVAEYDQNKINQRRLNKKIKATKKAEKAEERAKKRGKDSGLESAETADKKDKSERSESGSRRRRGRSGRESGLEESTVRPQNIDFNKPLTSQDFHKPQPQQQPLNASVSERPQNGKMAFRENNEKITSEPKISGKISFAANNDKISATPHQFSRLNPIPKALLKTTQGIQNVKNWQNYKPTTYIANKAKAAVQRQAKKLAAKATKAIVKAIITVIAKVIVFAINIFVWILVIIMAGIAVILPFLLIALVVVAIVSTIVLTIVGWLSWLNFNSPDIPLGETANILQYYASKENELYLSVDTERLLNDPIFGALQVTIERKDEPGFDIRLVIFYLTAKHGDFTTMPDWKSLVDEFFHMQYELDQQKLTADPLHPVIYLVNHYHDWDNFVEMLKETLTEEQRERFESMLENGHFGVQLSSPVPYFWFSSPVPLSSTFGYRQHPLGSTDDDPVFHQGIDISRISINAPLPPILAVMDGEIIFVGQNSPTAGNWIVLYNEILEVHAIYMHLDSIASGIAVGSMVTNGQEIGIMGTTGASTGVHLHFEVMVGAPRGAYTNGATRRPFVIDPVLITAFGPDLENNSINAFGVIRNFGRILE